ncbi:MAG TPA: carbon-nitrogen hydrolase family protein [Burkholderiales bacterium]|nr:carbon-nitrogen hydrolase family protein [Burkholderiales bacterium]
MTTFKAALLQMQTGNDIEANLDAVKSMAREAAAGGARFVMLPEYALMMDGSGRNMRDNALPADGGPVLLQLRALARELKVWLLVGSLTLKTDDGRMTNRSLLLSDSGELVASYDKIHMFDATLPDGKVIRESSAYCPGDRAVVADTPWGKLGLTVCYDLRFPQLYRALAQAGARYLTVPSSFQRATGKDHWHPLLQARAIENACFVFAPAMCGEHPGNRSTYGHSLVVDPWGKILADGGESPGIVYADIDPARVDKVRGMLPCLTHDVAFQAPS